MERFVFQMNREGEMNPFDFGKISQGTYIPVKVDLVPILVNLPKGERGLQTSRFAFGHIVNHFFRKNVDLVLGSGDYYYGNRKLILAPEYLEPEIVRGLEDHVKNIKRISSIISLYFPQWEIFDSRGPEIA